MPDQIKQIPSWALFCISFPLSFPFPSSFFFRQLGSSVATRTERGQLASQDLGSPTHLLRLPRGQTQNRSIHPSRPIWTASTTPPYDPDFPISNKFRLFPSRPRYRPIHSLVRLPPNGRSDSHIYCACRLLRYIYTGTYVCATSCTGQTEAVGGARSLLRSIRNTVTFGCESKAAATYRTVDPAFLRPDKAHHDLFGILSFRHTVLLLLPGLIWSDHEARGQ